MRTLLTMTLMLATTSAFAIGEPVCSPPTVTTETEACGNGHILTSASATNTCACPVTVTVHLKGNGAAVIMIKGHSSGRQMIRACDQERGTFTSFDYQWNCPEPDKPKQSNSTPPPAIKPHAANPPNADGEVGVSEDEIEKSFREQAKTPCAKRPGNTVESCLEYERFVEKTRKEAADKAAEDAAAQKDADKHAAIRAANHRCWMDPVCRQGREEEIDRKIAEEARRNGYRVRSYDEMMRLRAEEEQEQQNQPQYTLPTPSHRQQSSPNPYRQYQQQQQQQAAPAYQPPPPPPPPARPAPSGGGGINCPVGVACATR
jgi:hypothetical protein